MEAKKGQLTVQWHVDDVKISHKEKEVVEDFVKWLNDYYSDDWNSYNDTYYDDYYQENPYYADDYGWDHQHSWGYDPHFNFLIVDRYGSSLYWGRARLVISTMRMNVRGKSCFSGVGKSSA